MWPVKVILVKWSPEFSNNSECIDETSTQTWDKDTQTHTDTQAHTETHTHHIKRLSHTQTHTDSHTHIHTHSHTHTHKHPHSDSLSVNPKANIRGVTGKRKTPCERIKKLTQKLLMKKNSHKTSHEKIRWNQQIESIFFQINDNYIRITRIFKGVNKEFFGGDFLRYLIGKKVGRKRLKSWRMTQTSID